MAIEKKLICFARLEEFQRQLAAGNIKDYSIVLIQDANKIYNRGTYYDCQSPYVLPFDIETLDGLSYSDNEGRLQTDADVFEKAKSAIEMGRMVVIRYGLSDAGYHICDATYNGDAIRVCVYNGLMLYCFEIYASSQGSFMVEQYSLQSELVDGVNIATINGQSLTAGGDLTIEGGAKVYTWNWDGSESGTLTQEEYDAIIGADVVYIAFFGTPYPVIPIKLSGICIASISLAAAQRDNVSVVVLNYNFHIDNDRIYNVEILSAMTPAKTSQLENDSNFITSEDVAAVALSGSYNDLQDTPTIPTKTSQLINDNGLVDEQTLSTALEDYVLKDDGYAVADGLRDSDDTIFYLPSTAPDDTDRMLLTNGSLKTINGESIVGSGDITIQGGGAAVDNVYVTDFTVNDLDALIADPMLSIAADIPRMYDAMAAHKVVLVPYDNNEGFEGYGIAMGYKEDLFYVTITLDNGRCIDLEVSHDATGILGSQVRQRVWDDKQNSLESGTNIKTINGESILGSGNIEIEEKVQSDWLENDITSNAYIKNKTHNFEGLTITKAGNYSVTTNNNRVYFAGTKRVHSLDVGVRTQILSGPPIYVTLNSGGILTVEDSVGYLETFPLVSISSITPLDDMFIPETIARTSELKTINGESIVGSGNIVISGGVTQDYVDSAIANAITTTLNTAV